MGQLLALLSALSWGISNIYTRQAQQDSNLDRYTGQFITLFINTLTNIVVLIVYLYFFPVSNFEVKGFAFFVLAGILNSFVGRALLFTSISYIGAARAGAYKVTAPVFTVSAGIFILGEKISSLAWMGIIVVLIGVLLVTEETVKEEHHLSIDKTQDLVLKELPANKKILQKGVVLGLLSGFMLGSGNVFRKLGVTFYPEALIGVCIGSLMGIVFCTGFQMVRGKKNELTDALRTCWHTSYLPAGVYSSFAQYFLFFALLYAPVSIVNSITASEAFFTMLAGYIIHGNKEFLNMKIVGGAAVILAGVCLLFLD